MCVMSLLPAILAATFSSIFPVLVVMFLIVAISWVVRAVEKNFGDNKSSSSSGDRQRDEGAAERARQIAEERRRRLQELARQRQGQGGQSSGQPQRQSQPTSGGGTTTAPPPPPPPSNRSTEVRERDMAERRRRAQEIARQRAEQEREAQVAQRQAAQAQAAEAAAELERRRRLQAQAQASDRRQPDRMRVRPTQPGHESGDVHRHVADAQARRPRRRRTANSDWVKQLAGADRKTLQRAIILTEVFGKPVGLREPDEAGPNTVYSAP